MTDSHTPLNVTQKAEHRVFVGLSWDPNDNPSLGEHLGALIGKREKHHDLDLSCYYYDDKKSYLGRVTAETEYHSDASGKIYHSGDNTEGVGSGDDEQISVNLKSLPLNIHHLVFKVSICSGHTFGRIAAPAIRLCDGYTERCFVQEDLSGQKASEQDRFIFLRLYRHEGGWNIHPIMTFKKGAGLEKWEEKLAAYID